MTNISVIMEMASKLSLANLAKRRIKQIDDATEEQLAFLEIILREELWLRGESKKDKVLVKSKLPSEKTFAEFKLKFQPRLTKWHIGKLRETKWIDEKFNIIIVGNAGTGKSHIATAIGYEAVENKKKVFYTTLKDLIFANNSQGLIKASKTKLAYIRECDLIIIDEFGYTPIAKEDRLWLYGLLNEINPYTSIVIVTNRIFSKWQDIFQDEILATTLIDRLVEKCQIIKLMGESYRLEQHQNIAEKD